MPTITLDDRVRIPEDVVHREVGGETVLVNLQSGFYYGLDPVGTFIWEQLIRDGGLRGAYDSLLSNYDVEPEEAGRDLLDLAENLLAKGLVQMEEREAE